MFLQVGSYILGFSLVPLFPYLCHCRPADTPGAIMVPHVAWLLTKLSLCSGRALACNTLSKREVIQSSRQPHGAKRLPLSLSYGGVVPMAPRQQEDHAERGLFLNAGSGSTLLPAPRLGSCPSYRPLNLLRLER